MAYRTIKRVVTGTTQYDGAGVKLVRVIGHADTKDFDPFLMLDAFDSENPADYIKGFPWHPHRGIETVTYLISGDIEHGDSLGNSGRIQDGCCQWMTAGSGILHQEMPHPAPRMLGIQLWLNLPRKDKMTAPKYRDIRAGKVPVIETGGCATRIIAGQYQGIPGAVQGDHMQMLFLDVTMPAGAQWQLTMQPDVTLFVYIVAGMGYFAEDDQQPLSSRRAALFNSGDTLIVRAAASGMRFFLFAGKPLHEPIAWGGPIFMNTREELDQAFRELDDGTFIK
jgi:redox-sensitive bicupin YhaK (pirin superfamily)